MHVLLVGAIVNPIQVKQVTHRGNIPTNGAIAQANQIPASLAKQSGLLQVLLVADRSFENPHIDAVW